LPKPRGTDRTALPPDGEKEALSREPTFEAAFRMLFAARFSALYSYLRRLSGDAELADDIAQEAFVRLFQRGVMPDDPAAWLVSVANNLLRDEQRKKSRRARLLSLPKLHDEDPGESGGPESDLLLKEQKELVRGVLNQMSQREQQLLVLHHEGYSYREIALALGIAPTSVGTLLIRATAAFARGFARRSDASD
jgi:RNA polymerase sigma-70 factor, ECF subfamily